MSDQPKPRVRKDIRIEQTRKGVTIDVFRWRDEALTGLRRYRAQPTGTQPRSPEFIARRIERGIRLLSASLKKEWEAQ